MLFHSSFFDFWDNFIFSEKMENFSSLKIEFFVQKMEHFWNRLCVYQFLRKFLQKFSTFPKVLRIYKKISKKNFGTVLPWNFYLGPQDGTPCHVPCSVFHLLFVTLRYELLRNFLITKRYENEMKIDINSPHLKILLRFEHSLAQYEDPRILSAHLIVQIKMLVIRGLKNGETIVVNVSRIYTYLQFFVRVNCALQNI